ncbi:MAG: hypothetical protein K6G90_05150 [Clostridia bacterium]|nr:hypothetical protein [Clostridia bacterium]
MKRFSIYGLISVISILVRNFVLPNPFECFGERAVIINWIAEPVIQIIAYLLVGLVYKKGSNPAFGSLLFLITYAFIVGILWVLGKFNFAWWWILICVIAFIVVSVGIRLLISKLADDSYYE